MEVKQSDDQNYYDQFGLSNIQIGHNVESPKYPYPKRILLLLGNQICERITWGLTGILVLFLNEKLGYSEDEATVLYHGFTMLTNLMCIPGGVISDVWFGKFKTVLYFSLVYAFGCVAVWISSIPNIDVSPKIILIIGLVLVAIGSGCIEPCFLAFGGDQFKLPEQAAQLATYFSLLYLTSNFGSVITTTLTPILRSDVHCFGDNDCYPLAFGVPVVFFIMSIAFFVIGKSSYTMVKVSPENLIVQVTKCIWNAITTKLREGHQSPRKNLLDYSIDKYGEQLISDIRTLLRILVLYLPMPIFWTLDNQQGSRWTFQAKQMNGDIGFYNLKPDHMQMVNPLLVFIMIPLFEAVVYPILRRFGIRRPLQKIVIGGILVAVSFVIAAIVQFRIEATPKNTVHMLWQLPQYVVILAGEIQFGTVGFQFAYSEAPEKMKSIVLSLWSLTLAAGNLITLLFVSSVHIFDNQSHEFLFFAGLMVVDVLIFGILAYFYKSTVYSKKEQPE